MIASDFCQQVYRLCKKIPPGNVTTYREIARALNTKGYQAVGQALRCNPFFPEVPCHRIIKSNGTLGGFKGRTNGKELSEKVKLLQQEGVTITNQTIDLKKYLFKF